jgi:small subunit ribosomal protein S1
MKGDAYPLHAHLVWIYTQQIRMNDETQVPTATDTLNGHNGHEDVSEMTSDMTDEMADAAEQQEMQRLLDAEEGQFKTIKRGDVVEGQIVHMDADEILVDIGLKSEGVLNTKELASSGYGSLAELHVGDNVLVYVMQPETPEGHAVVSIKRARQERQWRIAQEQFERGELLEAEVIDHNKGGLIVNLEGIRGFVPISQILNLKREDNADSAETQNKLQAMVGKSLQLKIIEINRNRNRLILSERLAVQEWRARRREELLNELEVGEIRQGTVSNLANFGAFVDLGGADGLVHISQLAWSRVNHPSEVLKVGQTVEVQVLSVDKERKKIALSIKRAEVDPWTTVEQRYEVGQLVQGTITKIAPFGAFARIEDGVEGLIHLSEMPAGTQDPKAALQEGQEVSVRIVRIEPDRRRLGLSIRQSGDGATAPEGESAEAMRAEPQGAAEAGAPESAQAPRAEATSSEPATRARPAQPETPTTAMAEAFRAFQQQQATRDGEAADASATVPQAPTEASDTAAAESAGDLEPTVVEQAVEAPDVDVTLAPDAPAPEEAEPAAISSAESEAATPEVEAAEPEATAETTPEDKADETPATEDSEGAAE